MDFYPLRMLLKECVSAGILCLQVTKSVSGQYEEKPEEHWVARKSKSQSRQRPEESRPLQLLNHLFKVTSLEWVNPNMFSVCISPLSRFTISDAGVFVDQAYSRYPGSDWVDEEGAGWQSLWRPLWTPSEALMGEEDIWFKASWSPNAVEGR